MMRQNDITKTIGTNEKSNMEIARAIEWDLKQQWNNRHLDELNMFLDASGLLDHELWALNDRAREILTMVRIECMASIEKEVQIDKFLLNFSNATKVYRAVNKKLQRTYESIWSRAIGQGTLNALPLVFVQMPWFHVLNDFHLYDEYRAQYKIMFFQDLDKVIDANNPMYTMADDQFHFSEKLSLDIEFAELKELARTLWDQGTKSPLQIIQTIMPQVNKVDII